MNPAAANRALAANVLTALHAAGARTLCLCPGGRNAPLVLACDAARGAFDVVSFFDERSAAFFALGRIRRDGAPAAVITTSGTAAAELLPAMLEAQHGGLPLLAVTADRPRRLRGTGAPQTIDQPPLFTATGAPVFDIDSPSEDILLPAVRGPVHLNVCFDEPLVGGDAAPFVPHAPDTPATPDDWMTAGDARIACDAFFSRVRNPLVLVSSLDARDAALLAPWLASLPCPMHLEAVSQLRGHPDLQARSLHSGERILGTPEARAACDGILRIGGVPTPRFWRDCEENDTPVLHISRTPFPGLARPAPVVPLPLFATMAGDFSFTGGDSGKLFERDRAMAAGLERLLESEPLSEAAFVRNLAVRFPSGARIFLGNSLPIREWDLAAPRTLDTRTFFANRGVNGIDGLVSTALGLADGTRPLAAVIGDLSALYDLSGLWPAAQVAGSDVTLAVINNGGGQIFGSMFRNTAFLNTHRIGLQGWAEMFGWSHAAIRSPDEAFPGTSPKLVEVFPDPAATARFAGAYADLWA
ncbi:MAG: 2-succinyl-5-enolpyruvyl-6-hydroxy-3-cyclohexene-1-carboxylic-acid synthase [Chthoniobacterales bacterium]|nr:2-succinyl-5-enolpyruvyl-6-hydroxy-3-cyclohexene-1-carboxylic-acid synthase [Chthoniobacterales bacterium]